MWPATRDTIRRIQPRWCLLENVAGLVATGYLDTIVADLHEIGYDARWDIVSAADCGAPHRRDRLWIVAHTEGDPSGGEIATEPVRHARLGSPDSGAAMAHTRDARLEGQRDGASSESTEYAESARSSAEMAHATGAGSSRDKSEIQSWQHDRLPTECCTWWDEDPADVPDTGICADQPGEPQPSQRPIPNGDGEGDGGEGQLESRLGRVADGVPNRVDLLKGLGNAQVPIVAATAWRLLAKSFDGGVNA